MAATRKPRLGVFKFSSCDGCQLSLLDCEDQLLAVAGAIDIAYFPEATRADDVGHYDLALVEGSVTTPHEAEIIHSIRKRATTLVTIGACATAGGIQALRNGADVEAFARIVYAHPEFLNALSTSTPIGEHVKVDFELRGCPVNKNQLVEVIAAFVVGRKPDTPAHAACIECKLAGHVCVMVAHGTPCLGPVTHAGCGALCPGHDRGCYGCFGPKATPNTAALAARLAGLGASRRDVARLFSTFNANAPAFRREAQRHAD
ncbi:MAG: oxidoreductase [Phyllobacteriaceae bacterium]|nr:oxidoreductase [Phyllobacteriaceae bacterium]